VVERGKGDGVFITTTGIGLVPAGLQLSANLARPGDRVILSGSIGDHGVAVMSKRNNLGFETDILSDSAALHGLVADMVRAAAGSLRVMRDPTRGGLAAALNEIAQSSGVGFLIDEERIPVRQAGRDRGARRGSGRCDGDAQPSARTRRGADRRRRER
jgi:hydrogenase expression/formation protein HypE